MSRWIGGIAAVGLAALQAAWPGQARAADAKGAADRTCQADLSFPAFSELIKENPDPTCIPVGPLGDIYVGGAFTGYTYRQTNPLPTTPTSLRFDETGRLDFPNLQAIVQKPEGTFQFYVQAGAYAIPALGLANYRAVDQTSLLFGPLPIAYGKIVLDEHWSVQAGRMQTLIGTELPFTYQNLNIQRGLLFNQENLINQGVQLNYSNGPLDLSVAGTDGFFSGRISWLSGALTYKLDDHHTVGVNGGFNAGRTNVANQSLAYQFATPLLQQNSGIVSVNYTYRDGPLTVTPYLQHTRVERDATLGILRDASTYGAAILASYALTENFGVGARVEYEQQNGRRGSDVPSLLYGPGSGAFSVTVTPTYTSGRFFVRGEYSRVELNRITRGDVGAGTLGTGFGRTGNKDAQDRYMVETGLVF